MNPISPAFLWGIFIASILVMLYLDLCVFNRKAHKIGLKESIIWSVIWTVVALVFNAGIYVFSGPERAFNFFTGYLIERSLSMDNLFVFLLVINYFKVPAEQQHSVLFWGIFGAFLVRGLFIVMGIALIAKFHWMIYVFGLFLLVTGIKMLLEKEKQFEPERNPVLKLFRKFVPISADYEGGRYFVFRHGHWWVTPLFVALFVLDVVDVVFAVDSIPAILAVTRDPFIVYSSNCFAILGLRALYFVLAAIMDKFHYLNYGLSLILVLIGGKMLLDRVVHVPAVVTLITVSAILALSIAASFWFPLKKASQD